MAVSYTHLDVYKRQAQLCSMSTIEKAISTKRRVKTWLILWQRTVLKYWKEVGSGKEERVGDGNTQNILWESKTTSNVGFSFSFHFILLLNLITEISQMHLNVKVEFSVAFFWSSKWINHCVWPLLTCLCPCSKPVSYTHLDVYKRQLVM